MNRELLYIPGLIMILLPIVRALHAAAVAARAEREKQEKRAAAAAEKAAAEQAKQAEKAARAAAKQAAPVQDAPRRRGRPRKNPPAQRPETILQDETPAPVQEPPAVQLMTIQRASAFPCADKMEPPCSPEDFAARIR